MDARNLKTGVIAVIYEFILGSNGTAIYAIPLLVGARLRKIGWK